MGGRRRSFILLLLLLFRNSVSVAITLRRIIRRRLCVLCIDVSVCRIIPQAKNYCCGDGNGNSATRLSHKFHRKTSQNCLRNWPKICPARSRFPAHDIRNNKFYRDCGNSISQFQIKIGEVHTHTFMYILVLCFY